MNVNPRIMLVRNEKKDITVVQRLKQMDFDLTTVVLIHEAVQSARENDLDVVLFEIKPGGESVGITIGHQIINCSDLPIIYLIAPSSQHIMHDLGIHDPSEYAFIPLNSRELKKTIHMALYKNCNINRSDSALKKFDQEMELEVQAYSHNQDENRDIFHALAEKSLVGIFLIQDNLFRFINPKFTDVFGYCVEEVVDKKGIRDLIVQEDWRLVRDRVEKTSLEDNEYSYSTMRGRKKNGEVVYLEIYSTQINYHGGKAVIGTFLDFTENRRMSEAYRLLVEQSIYGLAIYTEDKFLFTNPRFSDMLGYSTEEILFRSLEEMIHPQDRGFICQRDLDFNKGKYASPRCEYRMVRKDGSLLWVETYTVLVEFQNIKALQSYIMDISERKRAEEALRQSETNLRALMDATQESMLLMDLEGTVFLANETAARRMGMTVTELVGSRLDGFIPIEIIERNQKDCTEYVKSIEPVFYEDFQRNRHYDTYFYPVYDQNGKIFEVAIYSQDVTERKLAVEELAQHRDHLEELVKDRTIELGYVNVQLQEEISERIKAENVLRESEEKFRNLVQQSSDGIVLVDDKGIVVEWNREMENITGLIAEKAIGKYFWQLQVMYSSVEINMDDFEKIKSKHLEMSQTGKAQLKNKVLEVPFRRTDNSPGMAQQIFFPIQTQKGYMLGCVIRDVTDRHRMEEALRQSHYELEKRVSERTIELTNTNIALEVEIRERIHGEEYQKELIRELKAAQRQLQALSRRLVEAQEAERRSIAGELHDEIGQALTGLKLVLEIESRRVAQKHCGNEYNKAKAIVDELMDRVSSMSLELRPPMLDNLGLLPALLWHLNRYSEQTGIEVDFKHQGVNERRFTNEIETAAYRIIQEALTNIARHARVKRAAVQISVKKDVLWLRVEDNGMGFNPSMEMVNTDSYGLVGMRERAYMVGGVIQISSIPGKGTTIECEMPLSHAAVKEVKDD